MLVLGIADPLSAGVIADSRVVGINANDFVVLHGGILIDPVRVQDTEVAVTATNLFLSEGLQVSLEFQLTNTLMSEELG